MGANNAAAADQAKPIVLVVEPSILARLVLCDYLRDCQYRVLEASNSEEALAILGESGLSINVVLSEVQLPGEVDGFSLMRSLRKSHPQVRVILAGSVDKAADAAGELCEEGPLLSKPYDQSLVVDRIKRLLAAAKAQEP